MEPEWTASLAIELRCYFAEEADEAASNFGAQVEAIAGLARRAVESDADMVDRIDLRRSNARVARLLMALSERHIATLQAAFGGDHEGLSEDDRTTYGDELAAVLALNDERHGGPEGREHGARAVRLAQARLDAAKAAYSRAREVE